MAVQKQISVALASDVRERLEAAAAAAGHSVAEELRRRIERTLEDDDSEVERPDVIELMAEVGAMACLCELTVGNRWNTDPRTAALLLLGVGKLILRALENVDSFYVDEIVRCMNAVAKDELGIPLTQQFHRGMVDTVKRQEGWKEDWQEDSTIIAELLGTLVGNLKKHGHLRGTIASHVNQGSKLRANLIQQLHEDAGKLRKEKRKNDHGT